MSYVKRMLHRITGILLLVGVAAGLTACTEAAPEPHHQSNAEVRQTLVVDTPENLAGCNEIDIDQWQRGDLGTYGAVDERAARAVIVHDDIGPGSHIGLAGEDSCLWITGNIGPDTHISISGDGSGVVVEGAIDPSVVIEVSGVDAITWLPKVLTVGFAGEESPTLRIAGTGEQGILIIDGNTEVPH